MNKTMMCKISELNLTTEEKKILKNIGLNPNGEVPMQMYMAISQFSSNYRAMSAEDQKKFSASIQKDAQISPAEALLEDYEISYLDFKDAYEFLKDVGLDIKLLQSGVFDTDKMIKDISENKEIKQKLQIKDDVLVLQNGMIRRQRVTVKKGRK